MKASDLIAQASRLAKASQHKPRQVDLKRAVSADYDPQSLYIRADVTTLVVDAAQAIADLGRAARADRRAFVAFVLLREPRR